MANPVLSGLVTGVTFDEDVVLATPQLLDANVTVSDADGNWAGGSLFVGGVLAQDRLSIQNVGTGAGQIGFNAGTGVVTYGGVVIGQAVGGSGGALKVVFNANASSAAIEALVERLTYQNVSENPVAAHNLTITLSDGSGATTSPVQSDWEWNGYNQAPLGTLNVGSPRNSPIVVDLDGDGDLDMVSATHAGGVAYLENTGTLSTPVFVLRTGAANPFNAIVNVSAMNSDYVSMADLDGDGDQDLVVSGADYDTARYFRNIGTATAAVFTELTGGANPIVDNGIAGNRVLVDLDRDGRVDLVKWIWVDGVGGVVTAYRNTGTTISPVFTLLTGGQDPFAGLVFEIDQLAFVDADQDGDLDLIYTQMSGKFGYAENTAGHFTFDNANGNPMWTDWYGSNWPVAPVAVPFHMDIDGDGDLDMVSGFNGGGFDIHFNIATPGVTVAVNITPEEDPSVAVNDIFAVSAGASSNHNAAANDTGAEGAAPLVTHVNGLAVVGTQITLASGAKLTVNANGTLTYNPNGAFNALGAVGSGAANTTTHEDVTYTLTGGVTATIRFNITGADDADRLAGTAGADAIDGGLLNDYIDGGAGGDDLTGGSGDDYLRGGDGLDEMRGGLGNDTYVVDQLGDSIDETGGDGVDLVWSRVSWTLGAGFENLTLGAGGLGTSGTGNSLANLITGNAFANTLQGLDGDDTLIGDGGNDVLSGGAGSDTLTGGGGSDHLDGGAGADAMDGGAGHDVYVVDDQGDTVTETLAGVLGGTDTVRSWVSFTNMEGYIENVVLLGSGDTWAFGNALSNTLTGNSGANMLLGGEGNDTILGGDGSDTIFGGAGSDKLTGGAGADNFIFLYQDLTAVAVERDQIFDLNFAQGDMINLQDIDANIHADGDQNFSFVAKFTKAAGQATLKYAATTNLTTLELDVDGDGKADFRIAINGDHSGTTGNLYTGAGDANGGWFL